MGGCIVLVLLPLIMGVGLVLGLAFLALPLYAAFSAIMLILLVAAYGIARRRGLIERYQADGTWRRPVSIAAVWLARFAIAYFALSGIVAGAMWAVLFMS